MKFTYIRNAITAQAWELMRLIMNLSRFADLRIGWMIARVFSVCLPRKNFKVVFVEKKSIKKQTTQGWGKTCLNVTES